VQWKHLSPEEATWEMEDRAQEAYPFLFQEDPEKLLTDTEDGVSL